MGWKCADKAKMARVWSVFLLQTLNTLKEVSMGKFCTTFLQRLLEIMAGWYNWMV